MSAEERKALAAAVEPRKQEVGWRLAEDPVTGARVGLPGQVRHQDHAAAERHALGVRAGPVAGRDLPHRHRRDARRGVRAAEENAAPPHRQQRAAGRQLRHLRDAGLEEDGGARLRARTARCAASPSSTTRRWKAPWTRWWRRCRAPSCRSPRALRWRARPTRARRKVEYGTGVFVSPIGPRADRPATDRRLQRHRAAGPRQRRTHRHRCQRRARAAARLWRAKPRRRSACSARAPGGAERHAGRHRRSAGAGRRRGDLGGQRQARRRGGGEPARNRAGAGILRRRRARRARAASPAWW